MLVFIKEINLLNKVIIPLNIRINPFINSFSIINKAPNDFDAILIRIEIIIYYSFSSDSFSELISSSTLVNSYSGVNNDK